MSDRRSAILDAAQCLFLEKGYAATSIADIRTSSGASVGSIYHAFGSKDGIAVALVERAVGAWTQAAQQSDEAMTFEERIRATVEGLLRWAVSDPDAFLIMDELRSVSERGQAGERLSLLLAQGRTASKRVIESHVASGEIRDIPADVAQAMVLGPAYEFLRSCRARPLADQFDRIVKLLGETAWQALAVVH